MHDNMMKAAICTKYGRPEVVRIQEIQKPKPKKDEILVRVISATVQTGDCKVRDLIGIAGSNTKYNPVIKFLMRFMLGYNKPRNPVFGTELFGIVEVIGEKVTKHKVGDEIIVMTDIKMGAHAEYLVWPEGKFVVDKPGIISPEQAAALTFGGITALFFLRRSHIQIGQSILINGASGTVGSSSVQIAKYFGAIVTGVCGTGNVDLVKSIGADFVIDYTKESIEKINAKYDVIFDAVGKISKKQCKNILKPDGKFISVLKGIAIAKHDDLVFLSNLAQEGKYLPVIDKCFHLEEIVEAYKYVETGHKKGNVVIKMV
jgi:NADPH:quinone reductase-like Zn-dependent oxidoreductase